MLSLARSLLPLACSLLPLARSLLPLGPSLLTFATLLAAADAKNIAENYKCSPVLHMGEQSTRTSMLGPFQVLFPQGGGKVSIPDYCSYPKLLTGQSVRACSVFPPWVDPLWPDGRISDVAVKCFDGCRYGGFLHVYQFCGFATLDPGGAGSEHENLTATVVVKIDTS